MAFSDTENLINLNPERVRHRRIKVFGLMFVSTFKSVPEVITGLIGLVFIVGALVSSILYNKKHADS